MMFGNSKLNIENQRTLQGIWQKMDPMSVSGQSGLSEFVAAAAAIANQRI